MNCHRKFVGGKRERVDGVGIKSLDGAEPSNVSHNCLEGDQRGEEGKKSTSKEEQSDNASDE